MNLKLTEKLCIMTMNNDAKFEEELNCRFKIDMRNLANVYRHRLKNSDFILEREIMELNQNKN